MKLYSCFAIDHPFYISCYEICLHLYEVSTSKIAKLMILLLSWYHCMAPTMKICYIWKIPAWSLIDILIVNNSHFYAFWLSLYHSHWAFQLFIFLESGSWLSQTTPRKPSSSYRYERTNEACPFHSLWIFNFELEEELLSIEQSKH